MRLASALGIALVATVVVVAADAAVAAASVTEQQKAGRVEFIKRADNICQPQRGDAKRLIANGVRLLTKKHPRIQAAGREFMRAWRQMRTAYKRVGRLHRPHGFHRRIAKWLHRERVATGFGVRSGRALRRKHLPRSRHFSHAAYKKEQDAKRPVRNLDFQHCRPL